MDYGLIIFVLTGALVSVVAAQTRQYIFMSSPLNWIDAQSVCRQVYTDLATIERTADVSAIIKTSPDYTGHAWIGLHDDWMSRWKWSLGDGRFYEVETEFRNWYPYQPNNLRGQQLCVMLLPGIPYFGTWGETNCNDQQRFVCYNGTVNDTSSFVKVDTYSNWTEAQRFCRENYVDLASIRNQAENVIVTNLAAEDDVWIGLHWIKRWSDWSSSLFQHWANGQQNSGAEICVSTAFNDSGRWSVNNCLHSFPFICYTTNNVLPNEEGFRSAGQDETSITLQWNKVNNNARFILQFNGTEMHITAPDGDGPVTHTVSSLTAGTKYTFTLFSVFESVRSSGVNITAVTGPYSIVGLNIRLTSSIQLSDSDMQSLLMEFFKQNGLSPQFSLKIKSMETSGRG